MCGYSRPAEGIRRAKYRLRAPGIFFTASYIAFGEMVSEPRVMHGTARAVPDGPPMSVMVGIPTPCISDLGSSAQDLIPIKGANI